MLGGTLSTSPAQFTTIVASMFVNKTKTTLRAHTVDKNTSSVCGSKRRFWPKPHGPVLFLSIYRDTVPLIGKKIWLNRSKATDIPALEAFRYPDEGQPCITPEVISQARALLIAVYTNKNDDFMGAKLGKVRVYEFLNNISTLLKLLPPTEDALSNICDVQHWQLCWTRLHTLASLTSNHVKIMGGLWMIASSYQCHPHNQPGRSR